VRLLAWRTICPRCASTCATGRGCASSSWSSNLLERSLEEVRRRTKVIGLVIDAAHGLGLPGVDRQHLIKLAAERDQAREHEPQIE
jgi:hypothetical protein